MSILSNTLDRIARRLGYIKASPEESVRFEIRSGIYAINQMLYDGSVYQTRANAGALEEVLSTFIGPTFCNVNRHRIHPYFMPFREIVDAYQYVLPGTWGEGVKIADTYDGKPINQQIIDPLGRIWRASNLDSEKAKAITWAANFGTVGLRITARGAVDDRGPRVAVGADHPSRLFNFEEDAEGNVTAVCLKYKLPVNRGTLADPDWQTVDVVEEITKEGFSIRHDDAEQLEDDHRANTLGFCPYVILRHRDNGTPYGDWAYRGTEAPVHRLNWRITRQDKSIDRHQFPKWFAAAGGNAPTTDIDMGDEALTYVQTIPGTPPPVLEAIVPQIDQSSAQEFWMQLQDMLRGRQPELNLNDVKLLGNTSGEALAQILKPTEKAIGDVRPAYHHAFTRALQMGLSAGVQVGAWDIGTGTGDGAGDRAFRAGLENFAFAPMPLLPPTAHQITEHATASTAEAKAKLQLAQQAKAVGLPLTEQWRLAGYADAEIAELRGARAAQAVLPEEDDAE